MEANSVYFQMVEEAMAEAEPGDLQSPPIGRSGNPPG